MTSTGMLRAGALKDKVIVVTGGGSGLGKAMSTCFSDLGAKVIIASRSLARLEKAAREISASTGGEVLPLACDVRDYSAVEAVIEEAMNNFGAFTGLVNNAAGNFISRTESLSANAFSTVIDIVLKGTANFSLAAGKHWIKKKEKGTILNIVTTYAFTGSAFVVPSACAKGGVLAMTRSLAVEWGQYGIRTNAVAPGPFPTKGAWERLLPGELAAQFNPAQRVPLGRVGNHQELADLASYLMSDFSAYINGEVISIDGGEWLQGAGQFNGLKDLSADLWNQFEALSRSAKDS